MSYTFSYTQPNFYFAKKLRNGHFITNYEVYEVIVENSKYFLFLFDIWNGSSIATWYQFASEAFQMKQNIH